MAKNITKLKHRLLPSFLYSFDPFSLAGPILLLAITLYLCYLNYQPRTTLTGWDNLQSELNLPLNLQRSLFAVWQEYQSFGLLGGMAHAADLPRLLYLFVLSFFVPTNLLRYFSIFTFLVLGPLGTYFFIKDHLTKPFEISTRRFASTIGALFYLFNLSTLQTFYTPFESITAFYALAPWLLYFLVKYLKRPSLTNLFYSFLVTFLCSPAFYVETFFVVYLICSLPFFAEHLLSYKHKTKSLVHLFNSLTVTFVSSSYWLLPVMFFVSKNGAVATTAKINTISSPEIYYRNLEFGNLADLGLLKGFWFNFLDLSSGTNFDYLLSIWRNHLSSPSVLIVGYLLFSLVIIGIYYSLKKNFPWSRPVLGIFTICYLFLIGSAISWFGKIPLFGELFRSPFTKFSQILAFSYACFFSIGTVFLLDLFSFLHRRLSFVITFFSLVFALYIFISPFFSGQLISPNMRLIVPEEYNQLYSFLNQKDLGRVTFLPQHTFWGWNYYSWGYRGSGFPWYGLKDPITDRAFDVWDTNSEKYYQLLSQAIYNQDSANLSQILNQYQIKYLVIDNYVVSPDGRTDLFIPQAKQMLEKTKQFKQIQNFSDQILVYENQNLNTNSFINTTSSDYTFQPYLELPQRPTTSIQNSDDNISIPKLNLQQSTNIQFKLPSYTATENTIPVHLSYQKDPLFLSLIIKPILPEIIINQNPVDYKTQTLTIPLPSPESNSFILKIGDNLLEVDTPSELTEVNSPTPLGDYYLPTTKPFAIKIFDAKTSSNYDLTNSLANANPFQCFTNKPNRKIEKITSPDSISILGTDVVGCLSASLPTQPTLGLVGYHFDFSSQTLTNASVTISDQKLNSAAVSSPIAPKKDFQPFYLFAETVSLTPQINLILEANETKSIQTVTFRNISTTFYPLSYSTTATLPSIPSQNISINDPDTTISISLPIVKSPFDIHQTPFLNSLFPESRNCDQYNHGKFTKSIADQTFKYFSLNAIECDQLDLRSLPHNQNYLFSFQTKNLQGLPLTLCLENHSTHRCDIYERLLKTDSPQAIINPISNPNETPGYTLTLFNQSIGINPTSNSLSFIKIHPIPLKFLQNITLSSSSSSNTNITQPSSISHPAEFLYTVSGTSNGSSLLNLYQTESPYWKAFQVLPGDIKDSLPLTIFKTPFLYGASPKLKNISLPFSWYNSFALPSGNYNLILVYLPQYLEFLGFALIGFTLLTFIITFIFTPRKK